MAREQTSPNAFFALDSLFKLMLRTQSKALSSEWECVPGHQLASQLLVEKVKPSICLMLKSLEGASEFYFVIDEV